LNVTYNFLTTFQKNSLLKTENKAAAARADFGQLEGKSAFTDYGWAAVDRAM
jgi:hypothetical protein